MKTKITFEKKSDTSIGVWREGKEIGCIWSEKSAGGMPYPHDDSIYCKNAIQICGFDAVSETWGCGIFKGKKDLVVSFDYIDDGYKNDQVRAYERYLRTKMGKHEFDDIQNFHDFLRYNIDGR